MKIGIATPYLDSLSGGEKYMLQAALCVASFGHQVSILWNQTQEAPIKQKAKERFGFDLSKVAFDYNIFSSSCSFLSRYRASKKYDKIFYLSDGSLPLVATDLYVHFQFPVEWVKYSFADKIKMQRVKKVICNSFFTKNFIDKKFLIDSAVLYPPIKTNILIQSQKENVILHVGRIGLSADGINFKKQDVMITTFKKMVDKGFRFWRLVLVVSAKDSDKGEIDRLVKLADGYPIEILQNVNDEVLQKEYDKAKIYWHATGFGEDLVKHPERAEHFGMTTVEAMAHKVVPVVINAGGQREIVEEGKTGYLWDTTDQLAEKTLILTQKPGLLEELGEAGAVASARFSEENFCNNFKELLGL